MPSRSFCTTCSERKYYCQS